MTRLSVIVVAYDMDRELPRTLHTLSTEYQRGIEVDDFEVLVIDNGSAEPVPSSLVRSFGSNMRLIRHEPGNPSPVSAVNAAAREATGDAITLCIDGARMLSPGVLGLTREALLQWPQAMVATLAWHLGPQPQNQSMLEGYDRNVEDRLLESVDWRTDGYSLFDISALAPSSSGGWFAPMAESNCLTVTRADWERLDGLDEGFASAGGGLVNLDFYRRATDTCTDLVVLLGEGTFHQFHRGVATNTPAATHPFPAFHDEYVRLRGKDFEPSQRSAVYVGPVAGQGMRFVPSVLDSAVAGGA